MEPHSPLHSDEARGRAMRNRMPGAGVSARVEEPAATPSPSVTGLRFERYYTTPGVDPFDTVEWEQRDAVISNERGEKVFEQRGVEMAQELEARRCDPAQHLAPILVAALAPDELLRLQAVHEARDARRLLDHALGDLQGRQPRVSGPTQDAEYVVLLQRDAMGLHDLGQLASHDVRSAQQAQRSLLTLGAGALYGVKLGSVLVSVASTLGATAAFLVGRQRSVTLRMQLVRPRRDALGEKQAAVARDLEFLRRVCLLSRIDHADAPEPGIDEFRKDPGARRRISGNDLADRENDAGEFDFFIPADRSREPRAGRPHK